MKFTIRYLTHYQKTENDMLVLCYFVLICIAFCFAMAWLLGERLPYQILPLGFFIYILAMLRRARNHRPQKNGGTPVSDKPA